jgi:hypothetical protein
MILRKDFSPNQLFDANSFGLVWHVGAKNFRAAGEAAELS